MYVTITTSRGLGVEQAARVESFLAQFLPRLKQESGVIEILHGGLPDGRDLTTIIVWESLADANRYREGALIKEALALEEELGLASTREAFAVIQHLA